MEYPFVFAQACALLHLACTLQPRNGASVYTRTCRVVEYCAIWNVIPIINTESGKSILLQVRFDQG